jgi:uncharacterized protein
VSVRQRQVVPAARRVVSALTRVGVVAIGLLLSAQYAVAATEAIPAAPTRWVTDNAGFLSAGTRAALDQRLEAYEKQTGHQVLVWIGTTLNGVPIEDFVVHAFEKWRVGRKGIDDGLVLFIFAQDRRLRIEVGYGLEDRVPDVIASRIINDAIAPGFKAGNRDAALTAGVEAIVSAIEHGVGAGDAGTAAGPSVAGQPEQRGPPRGGPVPLGQKILFGFLAIVFLIILVTNPRLALWILFNMLASGGRGGGSGGGSSFSGGGGRSGGGGASGSW